MNDNFNPYEIIQENVNILRSLRDSETDHQNIVVYCQEIASQINLMFQMEYAAAEIELYKMRKGA
jgi:hypothetical protein